MLYDRDGSGQLMTILCSFFRCTLGQISKDEMVEMFVMMGQEADEEDDEHSILIIAEMVTKAEEMFTCLDLDGDGEVTEERKPKTTMLKM